MEMLVRKRLLSDSECLSVCLSLLPLLRLFGATEDVEERIGKWGGHGGGTRLKNTIKWVKRGRNIIILVGLRLNQSNRQYFIINIVSISTNKFSWYLPLACLSATLTWCGVRPSASPPTATLPGVPCATDRAHLVARVDPGRPGPSRRLFPPSGIEEAMNIGFR